MSEPGRTLNERGLIRDLKAGQKAAFITCYDRYAPVLFGLLIKMVGDQKQAEALLETTFVHVHKQASLLSAHQPSLLSWLMSITRKVATDALEKKPGIAQSTIQLSVNQQVSLSSGSATETPDASEGARSEQSRAKEFLELVLVQRCTPEEAAARVGILPDTARQYLRFAVQQLRDRPAVR